MRPVLRFAPSPNGELHLGHALSALAGFEMARSAGGRFLLRIEDIDTTRCHEEFVARVYDDLAWLGVSWEKPVLRQSQHFADYAEAAWRLIDMGLLYPCFATRTEIAAAVADKSAEFDPEGAPLYPGLHKGLTVAEIADRKARGEPYALRLDMDRALRAAAAKLGGQALTFTELHAEGGAETVLARPERWGDCVIVRKDIPASYHLAVTVDDARQGITHVTRGRDLFAATDVQRLLQVLLGFPEPLYHHHSLIADSEGRKLSKSARDTSLRGLRAGGATPAEIRQRLGWTQMRFPSI